MGFSNMGIMVSPEAVLSGPFITQITVLRMMLHGIKYGKPV